MRPNPLVKASLLLSPLMARLRPYRGSLPPVKTHTCTRRCTAFSDCDSGAKISDTNNQMTAVWSPLRFNDLRNGIQQACRLYVPHTQQALQDDASQQAIVRTPRQLNQFSVFKSNCAIKSGVKIKARGFAAGIQYIPYKQRSALISTGKLLSIRAPRDGSNASCVPLQHVCVEGPPRGSELPQVDAAIYTAADHKVCYAWIKRQTGDTFWRVDAL